MSNREAKMKTILITVLFDTKDNTTLNNRKFDRFIIILQKNEYSRDKLLKIFELKGYSWDNEEQYRKGYKPIMEIHQIDLTNLEIY